MTNKIETDHFIGERMSNGPGLYAKDINILLICNDMCGIHWQGLDFKLVEETGY